MPVSVIAVVLIACAVLVVIGAEWQRLTAGLHARSNARVHRERARRKAELRVIQGDRDQDDFAESVRRDLDSLPVTPEPNDRRRQ
jgi:hypothetical protein